METLESTIQNDEDLNAQLFIHVEKSIDIIIDGLCWVPSFVPMAREIRQAYLDLYRHMFTKPPFVINDKTPRRLHHPLTDLELPNLAGRTMSVHEMMYIQPALAKIRNERSDAATAAQRVNDAYATINHALSIQCRRILRRLSFPHMMVRWHLWISHEMKPCYFSDDQCLELRSLFMRAARDYYHNPDTYQQLAQFANEILSVTNDAFLLAYRFSRTPLEKWCVIQTYWMHETIPCHSNGGSCLTIMTEFWDDFFSSCVFSSAALLAIDAEAKRQRLHVPVNSLFELEGRDGDKFLQPIAVSEMLWMILFLSKNGQNMVTGHIDLHGERLNKALGKFVAHIDPIEYRDVPELGEYLARTAALRDPKASNIETVSGLVQSVKKKVNAQKKPAQRRKILQENCIVACYTHQTMLEVQILYWRLGCIKGICRDVVSEIIGFIHEHVKPPRNFFKKLKCPASKSRANTNDEDEDS